MNFNKTMANTDKLIRELQEKGCTCTPEMMQPAPDISENAYIHGADCPRAGSVAHWPIS